MAKPLSKTKKDNGSKKPSGGIKKSQKKRTRIQVEQLNKQEFLLSDLNMTNAGSTKTKEKPKTLQAKALAQDQKKDKETRDKLEKQRKDTNDNMLAQLEMISGFSL